MYIFMCRRLFHINPKLHIPRYSKIWYTYIHSIWMNLSRKVKRFQHWNLKEGQFHWRIWGYVYLGGSGHQEYIFCKGSLIYRINKQYLLHLIAQWSMMYLHNYPKDPWDWYIYRQICHKTHPFHVGKYIVRPIVLNGWKSLRIQTLPISRRIDGLKIPSQTVIGLVRGNPELLEHSTRSIPSS